MNLKDGVLIQPDALSAPALEQVMRYVRRARKTQSAVSNLSDDAPTTSVEWIIDKNIRDTQEVQLTASIRKQLNALLDANIAGFIDPFYKIKVRDYEPLQILQYGDGGHYIPHVDAETLYTDDDGLELWEKTLDRDVSVVYFLNDGFAGGELYFPELDLTVQPVAGTLVCFPSDHNYIHGVQPVTAGQRYTLVTWMRVAGMPTPDEINQHWMDEYNRRRPRQIKQPPRLRRGGPVS